MITEQVTKRMAALIFAVMMALAVTACAQESDDSTAVVDDSAVVSDDSMAVSDDSDEVNVVAEEALELLRKATDYLSAEQSFRMQTETAIEFVLTTGQKLQFIHHVSLTMQRPNRLRADRLGELVDQSFYYDGTTLSINAPGTHYYASEAAPATIDEMLDFIRDNLGFVAPAADLVYTNAWDRFTEDLTSGFVVGTAMVHGVLCDHVAFRNDAVDWQIWIEQGDTPLPRRLVITSKLLPESPQFTVSISKWEPEPDVSEADFIFEPPEGSTRIDFMTVTEAAVN